MTISELLRRRLENQRLARALFRKPEDVVAWFGADQAYAARSHAADGKSLSSGSTGVAPPAVARRARTSRRMSC